MNIDFLKCQVLGKAFLVLALVMAAFIMIIILLTFLNLNTVEVAQMSPPFRIDGNDIKNDTDTIQFKTVNIDSSGIAHINQEEEIGNVWVYSFFGFFLILSSSGALIIYLSRARELFKIAAERGERVFPPNVFEVQNVIQGKNHQYLALARPNNPFKLKRFLGEIFNPKLYDGQINEVHPLEIVISKTPKAKFGMLFEITPKEFN
jgi:hypothetical protein